MFTTGFLYKTGGFLSSIASGTVDLLYPPICANCHTGIAAPNNNVMLCDACRCRLTPKKRICCHHCGSEIQEENDPADYCPRCRSPKLSFDSVVSIGAYENLLRKIVLQMKLPQCESLTVNIGRLLAEVCYSELSAIDADMIVAVPMHWSRRFMRGINSPELLAQCLGRRLDVPAKRRLLIRAKITRPQASLNPQERFRNIRGAFRVARNHSLDGARVLLVDDILTTGATAGEAASVLKKAGAKMVAVAVVARTQGD